MTSDVGKHDFRSVLLDLMLCQGKAAGISLLLLLLLSIFYL